MRCRILSITFLSFLLTSLALTSHAQSPSATSSQQEKEAVRTNTRLVQTDVSVLDGNGQFVGGLKREQFELRVGGSPRPILFGSMRIGTDTLPLRFSTLKKSSLNRGPNLTGS